MNEKMTNKKGRDRHAEKHWRFRRLETLCHHWELLFFYHCWSRLYHYHCYWIVFISSCLISYIIVCTLINNVQSRYLLSFATQLWFRSDRLCQYSMRIRSVMTRDRRPMEAADFSARRTVSPMGFLTALLRAHQLRFVEIVQREPSHAAQLLMFWCRFAPRRLYCLYSFDNFDSRALDLLDFAPFPIGHETGQHGDTTAETDEGTSCPALVFSQIQIQLSS